MNKLFKSALLTGAALVAVGAVSAPSFAQDVDTMKVEKPFRVKLGAFFPSDGDLKDYFGNSFFFGGVAYDFGKTTATNPIVYGAYTDYFKKSKDGLDYSIWGIGAHARFLFSPATAPTGQPYAELGLGYYSVKAEFGGSSDTEGKIGGKAVLGYQHVSGVFGEVEYNYIPNIEDSNPGGFRLGLGYRF